MLLKRLRTLVNKLIPGIILLGWACVGEPDLYPADARKTIFEQPSHFPSPFYDFKNNAPTVQRTTLGKLLFFDPILSRDSSISCESCHKQWAGFSDPGHALSHGIDNRFGFRNSPALSNLAWYPTFMHDGGIFHLENMPIAPITDTNEMDISLVDVLERLNKNSFYTSRFEGAYGSDSITTVLLMKALAQYMSAMISDNSKYDEFIKGKSNALDSSELAGLEIFRADCSSCHKEPLTTDFSFRNNGLTLQYADEGRKRITLQAEDEALFKVPNLRNIEYSKPYMHDGSIGRLEEVVEHYSSGIQPHHNLDNQLPAGGFQYSEDEKEALVAFLKSLTDHEFLETQALSNPW